MASSAGHRVLALESRMPPITATVRTGARHGAARVLPVPPGIGGVFDDELLRRYDSAGGMTTGDQLAFVMSERVEQPISQVARWIVTQQLVCVRARGQLLLPWFQFDRVQMAPHPDVAAVIRALHGVLDERGIALWFVLPHAALDGQWPVHVLPAVPCAVLGAAHQR